MPCHAVRADRHFPSRGAELTSTIEIDHSVASAPDDDRTEAAAVRMMRDPTAESSGETADRDEIKDVAEPASGAKIVAGSDREDQLALDPVALLLAT